MYPNTISLAAFGGDWDAYIQAVYDAYLNELVHGGLAFLGSPIRFKFVPATDGKGFAFWHAVQEGTASGLEEDRQIDLRRCERITWLVHMLASVTADGSQGNVLWWRNTRGSSTRIILWMPAEEYAVVLDERPERCMFWTSYMVRPGRARSFAREHADYWGLPHL